ncbi:MAG TPA: hypothetical protein VFM53_12865 [Anaeromyxobacteraceae bacterium]|nr:hypothetical protein [Anaeromyxobacteraceae bacterium]
MLVPNPVVPGRSTAGHAPAAGADATPPGVAAAPSGAGRVATRPADPVSLAGLAACVEDARRAALSRRSGPPEPGSFAELRSRLARAAAAVPAAWRDAVARPLVTALDGLGARGYARVLAGDPLREGNAGLLLDACQAVLQRGEGHAVAATAAFQEVVRDLYDGFLSAEDRKGVKPPDHGVTAPMVRWGSAEGGPYTWPATATAALGIGAAIVSLPAANAEAGLLAWPALAHEAAGHDVLAADDGLREELATAVHDRLLEARLSPAIATYWSRRIDETASDVLGVLNMGPAAAVGMVGYFRALGGAWRGDPALRTAGRPEDPHPADIARAWLSAETVRLLSFRGAGRWADRLVAEADRDLGPVRLGNALVTAEAARASAAIVARTIAGTPLRSLEGRSLREVQDWTDGDEAVATALRRELRDGGVGAPGSRARGAWAAHAVAAGVYEAVSGATAPGEVMGRMVTMLAAMHREAAGAPGPRAA